MEDLKNVLAENLIKYRKAANLTQAELAEKINYSDKAVSKWERGVACPDMTLLPRLAVLFDVRIDALFLDGENPDGTLAIDGLPWDDDGELRVAVFEGKSLRLREIYACPDAGMVLLLHPEKGRTELCGQERKAADYVKCDRE